MLSMDVSPDAEFGLDVYVSGFASSLRPLEAATRSQKAFYRLAKGNDFCMMIVNWTRTYPFIRQSMLPFQSLPWFPHHLVHPYEWDTPVHRYLPEHQTLTFRVVLIDPPRKWN